MGAPGGTAETLAEEEGLAELRALQEFMAQALFRPLATGDRMQRRWSDGRSMAAVTEAVIKPNDRLSAFERLEIYNRGYWFRVLDCLYEDFPAVQAILGQRKFHRLITAYLTAHPSESYTLRDLGERFPGYVQAHPELTAPHTAMALEAAHFEWAQVVAFDTEAKPALGVDRLLGVDPSTLRLGLQPYLTLLDLAYPLDEFVLSLRQRAEGHSTTSNTVAEAPEHRASRRPRRPCAERVLVVVHRYQNSLYYKRLTAPAFAILSALRAQAPLGEACERGAEVAPDLAALGEALPRWFHDWAALGWLCEA